MKKRFILLLTALFLFVSIPAAHAEPTPSSSPGAVASPGSSTSPTPGSPTAVDSLISYGSTGEIVVRIQLRLRELGYFNYKPTGNFQHDC